MPQNPIQVQVVDPLAKTSLNVDASDTLKTTRGAVLRVSVIEPGSAAGGVHDCAAVGDAAADNLVAPIPNAVGVYAINMPCAVGVTIIVGDGQIVSVSYQ